MAKFQYCAWEFRMRLHSHRWPCHIAMTLSSAYTQFAHTKFSWSWCWTKRSLGLQLSSCQSQDAQI